MTPVLNPTEHIHTITLRLQPMHQCSITAYNSFSYGFRFQVQRSAFKQEMRTYNVHKHTFVIEAPYGGDIDALVV